MDSISTVPTLLRKTVIPTRSGGAFSPGVQRKDSGKFSTQQSHRNAIPVFFLGDRSNQLLPFSFGFALQEGSLFQFVKSVLQLFLRIHHDGAVPRYGLLQRLSGHQ